ESGTLYTVTGDSEKRALIAVGTRRFRRHGDPLATVAFVEHDGVLYLQGDLGNYRRIATPPGYARRRHGD
ncbi:MAG: hypothetical protein JSW10_12480, partial [Pseudomonadota bacterium]